MDTADVVVIGAGANGASTAFHLAQARAGKVVVIERAHIAAGATGKSGALVRMHYTNEPETRLAVESLRYFAHWGELVGGDCGFRPVGLLVFTPTEYRHHLEANVAMQREVGANAQLITPEEARELDPSVYAGDVDLLAAPTRATGTLPPDHWERLQRLRATYDPDGVFQTHLQPIPTR
jgi:sarcosine oxidase subunit beta